ncbi:S8 family peptidase [Alloalcanivorax balearicus]|uniref:S8 family peptidase n=1 Tax=Alloalcanivorax balearicus TaxID=413232 RepID=UPI0021CD3A6F|nr:S8 family peptidase [Alloalcanivorax balearicus]
MASNRKHVNVGRFFQEEPFKSKRTGRGSSVPVHNRNSHGTGLQGQYQAVLNQYKHIETNRPAPITEDIGIYVEILSEAGCKLPLDSLDNRDFKLRAHKLQGDREVATVFIPESRRAAFLKKTRQYLDPSKDGKPTKDGEVFPKNHTLLDSISEIKLANLKSFWTDPDEFYPEDLDTNFWWEIWLKETSNRNANEIAVQLSERLNATLSNSSLTFFNTVVFLIHCSANDLKKAPELIGNLEELRKAKETPNPIVESSPVEQAQWVENIAQRIQISEEATSAVSILDTGVNYNHALLQHVCSEEYSVSWQPDWPNYDNYSHFAPYNDHGSLQAGLAAFGNLMDIALHEEPIHISHILESARILPPVGENEPRLYGAITVGAAYKLETDRPNLNRVYSLAVTSDHERESGQPSSWSAEIDKFCSGMEDGHRRLFVVSSGNNRNVQPSPDYWDQVCLAEIEDPAQAWNALTVGAYTEMTTNDDPRLVGWSPFASPGDVAPSSRSSVNWRWKKHAPLKPEVVAEGGNKLLSPDKTEVSTEDVVSLLTTSGRTEGQLFERNGDTSAACALISRQAAILRSEYPSLWPETIRGLIVHSSEWTPRMMERFGLLSGMHSPKIAKENLLRTVGYGVPSLQKAQYSTDNALTLVAEGELQPFTMKDGATASTDPKLNQMKLYQLPWPKESLRQLPLETEVKLKVTLSYFIEPNPGRRGYRSRYSYQSHGLRFETIRPGQELDNFRAYINGLVELEEYDGPEGDNDGWFLGSQLRTRGSIHSDTWIGTVRDLLDMHTIAIFPVGGWWKYRTAEDRWKNEVKFSLLVSIETPDQEIDIYSEVENLVNISIET